MAHNYSNTPHAELRNTIRIIQACLLANQPDRIVPRLLQGRTAEDVEAELAAEALAGTARSPERTAARAPTATQATNDALRDAIEKRFRAQNGRPG
jgi:hypothetical protein